MEITIIGPGAVGTLLGGLLQVKGHTVTLRGKTRPPVPGISCRVLLPDRWLLVQGGAREGRETAPGNPDAFLVTLGRHHLHAMRRPDFTRLLGSGDAPVVFFNCDPAEPDRLAVPGERLRVGLTLFTAVKLQEGDVELATPGPAIMFERCPVVARVFQNFSSFGFKLFPVDDLAPFASSFLVYQLLFLPVAMCNTTLACFLSCPEGRELALTILGESFEAMHRAGRALAQLPCMDPRELEARIRKKPESFNEARGRPDRGFNPLLQAYLRGRPGEASQLNRKMVELASAAGFHMTWNWRLLQKASRVASLGFYRDPGELLRSLA
jgi:ketopantoate reductase